MHTPVLLEQAIEGLNIREGGRYIDATAGEGGHVKKILEKGGVVLALDWDEAQVKNLTTIFSQNEKVHVVRTNFSEIESVATKNGFEKVDGVLFDFGLSMKQMMESGRGFSYRRVEDPLDMRIGEEAPFPASDMLNKLDEEQLYEIFARYGEEYHSGIIAKAIVEYRQSQKLEIVADLVNAIELGLTKCPEKHQHESLKVQARIFQALRIFVNSELDAIKEGLDGAMKLLNTHGRIAIITFHSLEDRVVKQYIREHGLKTLSKKVVHGDDRLSFERSAKLRVVIT